MDGTEWDYDNWDRGEPGQSQRRRFLIVFLASFLQRVFRRTRQEKFWTRAPRVRVFGQEPARSGQMVGWGLFVEKLEL